MEIKFEEIDEQDIVTLIAWFVKKKGKDMVIKTEDGYDIEITRKNKKRDSDDILVPPIICPVIV